jgi:hypothetical protein
VAEQKLDLLQFTARHVAETRPGTPQVVRGQLVDAGPNCRGAGASKSTLGGMQFRIPARPFDGTEDRAVSDILRWPLADLRLASRTRACGRAHSTQAGRL